MLSSFNPLLENKSLDDDQNDILRKLLSELNAQVISLFELYDDKIYIHLVDTIYGSDTYKDQLKKNAYLKSNSDNDLIQKLILKKKGIIHLYDEDFDNHHESLITGISSEVYLPLFNGSEVIGCLYIGYEDQYSGKFIKEQLTKPELKIKVDHLEKLTMTRYFQFTELKYAFNIIRFYSKKMYETHPNMVEHSFNTAGWALEIGQQMNLDAGRLQGLYFSALLHDVGYMALPNDLDKAFGADPGKAHIEIELHSLYGYYLAKEMLPTSNVFAHIPNIILHHHEYFDGQGYPDKLSGEEIPLESRIINVADSIERMLLHRDYDKHFSLQNIFTELSQHKDTKYDADCVTAAIQVLSSNDFEYNDFTHTQILWATLTLTFDERILNIEGTIENYRDVYMFRTNDTNFTLDFDIKEVRKRHLYINRRNNIEEYEIKSSYNKGNRLYISELKLKEKEDTFHMLWHLPGDLSESRKKVRSIIINRISANELSFVFPQDEINQSLNFKKLIKIDIPFDSGEVVQLSGLAVKTIKLGKTQHYNFKYINIHEKTRDKMFKHLFKHQIEVKAAAMEQLNK